MSSIVQEKNYGEIDHQHHESSNEQPILQDHVPDYVSHTENRLIRKIDLRLLPILGALYSIALIDRVNVSNPLIFHKGTKNEKSG